MDVSRTTGNLHEHFTSIEDRISRMDETWPEERYFTLQ